MIIFEVKPQKMRDNKPPTHYVNADAIFALQSKVSEVFKIALDFKIK